MSEQPIDAGEDKIDGRTRAGRAIRAQQEGDVESAAAPARAAARSPTRDAVRMPAHSPNRSGAVVRGHNGEMLSRSATDDKGDQFFVPPEEIPDGWVYQWNVVSVINSPDVALRYMNRMYANGWRPVPADRHPGHWTPLGHKGDIVVEGLRLEERPKILNDEALEDERRKALGQMRDRDQALMGGRANVRGSIDGEMMHRRYRGTGARVEMKIDPGVDIPAPKYEYE